MKKSVKILLFSCLGISFFHCQKNKQDTYLPILEDRAFSIENFVCSDSERYFDWQSSFFQNYLQKNITTTTNRNFIFKFRSDNFNRDGYGFRVQVFVNNIIRFRRSTREFPFETALLIPEGSVVSVRTYVEKYSSINDDVSGHVSCKVICE